VMFEIHNFRNSDALRRRLTRAPYSPEGIADVGLSLRINVKRPQALLGSG
jgi:hypothetical protein